MKKIEIENKIIWNSFYKEHNENIVKKLDNICEIKERECGSLGDTGLKFPECTEYKTYFNISFGGSDFINDRQEELNKKNNVVVRWKIGCDNFSNDPLNGEPGKESCYSPPTRNPKSTKIAFSTCDPVSDSVSKVINKQCAVYCGEATIVAETPCIDYVTWSGKCIQYTINNCPLNITVKKL